VTFVPTLADLRDDLTAAGIEPAQVVKHGEKPCFTHEGIEMRETLLTARKPG
jgi:hypothetical protein